MTHARRIAFALLSTLIASCGPGGTSVPLHRASGRVTYQGKPMAGVMVLLRPARTEGPTPVGQADADGKFVLKTAVGPDGQAAEGAPAGDYIVTITNPPRSESTGILDKPAINPETVPYPYADPKTSGIRVTIKAGDNAIEPIDLKGQGPDRITD